MDLLLQRIFDGMFNSAVYASLAIALVFIYRATGLLNFAQGELATISAFMGFLLLGPHNPAVAGDGLVGFLPGLPCDQELYRRATPPISGRLARCAGRV